MKFTHLIIGAMFIAPSIVLAQKVDMKLNLEKGKEYIQTIDNATVTKQTIMGQVQEMTQTSTGKTILTLEQDNGKSDDYKVTYEDIGLSATMMGQEQKFSSDTASLETVDPMSRIFANLTGKEFKAKISEKGMVEEITGLEELVMEAAKEMPGGQPAIDQISGSLGDDGFAKNLEITTDIFPAKAVKVGSSWTKEQFTSTGLPIISNTTYTLVSVERGTAIVNVVSKLTTDPNNASTEMQGMQATMYYEGDRAGTLNVDVASGWVTSGNLTDNIVGSITLAPNDQMPDGMTIPIEMTNNITISN